MKNKRFKVWLTRLALTSGVQVAQGELSDSYPNNIHVYDAIGICYANRNHWHRTRESAMARVEEMRKAAIKAAKRKLDKLTSMRVEVPE